MPEARWYVLNVRSGYEDKVIAALAEYLKDNGPDVEPFFYETFIPKEETVQIRRGIKVNIKKKMLQGYILIRMVPSASNFLCARKAPGVLGFLGDGRSPVAVDPLEVQRITDFVTEEAERSEKEYCFTVGETVLLTGGAFNSLNGTVEEVDEERKRVKVSVKIFGRTTPVEVGIDCIEKI